MGYVGWIGTFQGIKNDSRYKTSESELVRELRELGAVLHCKTSLPTSLMVGETINNIFGYTWNPNNRHLSSGGSSGGEGALIALRGSPAGFGTDIGGSVRIPAAFNGIYGIRPSAGRIPYEGACNSMDGQSSIMSVIGPMATSSRSLKLLFQSVLGTSPWLHDPLAVELPWRDAVEQEVLSWTKGQGQLAFGIMRDDGVVRPQPPLARAFDIVEGTLKRLGHKVFSPLGFLLSELQLTHKIRSSSGNLRRTRQLLRLPYVHFKLGYVLMSNDLLSNHRAKSSLSTTALIFSEISHYAANHCRPRSKSF